MDRANFSRSLLRRILLLGVCAAALFASPVAFAQTVPDAEVQSTVADVLQEPEFRHLYKRAAEAPPPETQVQSNWFTRMLERIGESIRDFFKWLFRGWKPRTPQPAAPKSSFWSFLSSGELLYAVVILGLVVVLTLIVVALVRGLGPRQLGSDKIAAAAGPEISPSTPPGDYASSEYERRAIAAAQRGDFRTAVRELVLGSMSWTERAGLIRYRRGLTNRDYIRAVWRQLDRRNSLLAIAAAFDGIFYGRRAADAGTFERCLAEFQQSFSREPADAPVAG